MIISLIPFKREILNSNRDISELKNQFNRRILFNSDLNRKTSNPAVDSYHLEGSLENDKFQIRRLISFGYSAFPVIVKGTISNKNGLQLNINYSFHRFVYFIFFLLLVLSLMFLINDFFPGKYQNEVDAILLDKGVNTNKSMYILFVLYGLVLVIFNYEISIVRSLLIKTLI